MNSEFSMFFFFKFWMSYLFYGHPVVVICNNSHLPGPMFSITSPDPWFAPATVTRDTDSLGTGGAGTRVTEEETPVVTVCSGQCLATDPSARVRSAPGIKLGVTNLLTVTIVVPGYVALSIAISALGAGPLYLLLLPRSVWIILKLILLLENRIFGPLLNTVDVETVEAVVTAPDALSFLDRTDTNQT